MKQKGFLLAAGISLAFVFTFSCSGDDGTDGTNGIDGAQGESGADGVGCTVSTVAQGTQVTCGSNTVIIPDGNQGTTGKTGDNCKANQDEDGIITITCGSNTVGIAFCGEENKFYNPTNQSCYNGKVYDLFTDSRDNKKYVYVEIGDQIWMAENLNYKTESVGSCYSGNASNCETYGSLYNWETAMNVCPSGWHLPTNEEWDKLFRYVDGNDGTSSPYSSSTAGKYLKTASGWNSSGDGEDTYGFAALPGGFISPVGMSSSVGNGGYWWSASEDDASDDDAYRRYMEYNKDEANFGIYDKGGSFSVRCLKN